METQIRREDILMIERQQCYRRAIEVSTQGLRNLTGTEGDTVLMSNLVSLGKKAVAKLEAEIEDKTNLR